MAAGKWPMDTRSLSSGDLELQAVRLVLESLNLYGRLAHQRILLHTDSTVAAAAITKGGSMSQPIQAALYELFWFCMRWHITLVPAWIPREENTLADALSKRGGEACDWQLHPRIFNDIRDAWGPFTVDLFASDTNRQFEPYYTQYHTPYTHGVNAFAQAWPGTSWCNPPFAVMGRALRHAAMCRARIALIAPFWPGAPWWHEIIENDYIFKPCVWACVALPQVPWLFLDGHGVGRRPAWHSLALLLDFASPNPGFVRIPAL